MTLDRFQFLIGAAVALLALSPFALGIPAPAVMGSTSQGADPDAVRESLVEVFLALQSAESRGADVSAQLQSLDQALALIQEGDPASLEQAGSIISAVNATIPQLVAEGGQRQLVSSAGLYAFLASLGAVGVLSYLYLPRLIWRSWVKAKRDWEVAAS